MPDTDLQDIFLGRQPILDRNQQLFAYELFFRSIEGEQPAAAVTVGAFQALSLDEALGAYQGFIKLDQDILFSELIESLPSRSVVLDIPDTLAQTPETIDRCNQLKQAGYVLGCCVSPESSNIADKPLLSLVETIRVNTLGVAPDRLKRLAEVLVPLRKTLLAGRVENDARMNLCRDLGFDLFEGTYFVQPVPGESKQMKASEMALLRLLGLISQDADTPEIEAVFKQEPVLTINLLRLTNSAGGGLMTKITSLRHAITLLGRRQLQRWLQLLLYSGTSVSASAVNPLLQLAATRGRLMELLVDHTREVKQRGRELVDQGFMVGILSLMPAVLGAQSREILSKLPLAAPVIEALSEHRGVLGDLLALAEVLESETPEDGMVLLRRLPGIDPCHVNTCLTRALGWANNLAR